MLNLHTLAKDRYRRETEKNFRHMLLNGQFFYRTPGGFILSMFHTGNLRKNGSYQIRWQTLNHWSADDRYSTQQYGTVLDALRIPMQNYGLVFYLPFKNGQPWGGANLETVCDVIMDYEFSDTEDTPNSHDNEENHDMAKKIEGVITALQHQRGEVDIVTCRYNDFNAREYTFKAPKHLKVQPEQKVVVQSKDGLAIVECVRVVSPESVGFDGQLKWVVANLAKSIARADRALEHDQKLAKDLRDTANAKKVNTTLAEMGLAEHEVITAMPEEKE